VDSLEPAAITLWTGNIDKKSEQLDLYLFASADNHQSLDVDLKRRVLIVFRRTSQRRRLFLSL
jgi:calcineurin-like phosphoesterase family protein